MWGVGYFDQQIGALHSVCWSTSSFSQLIMFFVANGKKRRKIEQKYTFKGVYQCLGATKKNWLKPKRRSTPGVNVWMEKHDKCWKRWFWPAHRMQSPHWLVEIYNNSAWRGSRFLLLICGLLWGWSCPIVWCFATFSFVYLKYIWYLLF